MRRLQSALSRSNISNIKGFGKYLNYLCTDFLMTSSTGSGENQRRSYLGPTFLKGRYFSITIL